MLRLINFQYLAMLVILASVCWITWQLQCLSSERTRSDIFFDPSSPTRNYMQEKVEGRESRVINLWSPRGSLFKRSMELTSVVDAEKIPGSIDEVEKQEKGGMSISGISSESAEGSTSSVAREAPKKIKKKVRFAEDEFFINQRAVDHLKQVKAEMGISGISSESAEGVTSTVAREDPKDIQRSVTFSENEFLINEETSPYRHGPDKDFTFWPCDK